MAAERPELPPRKATVRPDLAKEAKSLLECPCYSPLALLTHLETSQSDHKHVFKSFNVETPENDLLEFTEVSEPIIATCAETVRWCCQLCHMWLEITHTPSIDEKNKCTGPDYLCHHFHSQGLQSYQCCGCDYSILYEWQDPVISNALLKRLEATRPKSRSFADLMQQKEQIPTLVSTFSTVLVYIKNLLEGSRRNINIENPHFLARIGLDDGSRALLEEIGFKLEDNYLIAPEVETGSITERLVKQIQEEIILSLDTLRQELGSTTVPIIAAESNIKVKAADMQAMFGIVATLENRYLATNDFINQAYAFFGLTSGASDVLVSWAYRQLIKEPYVLLDSYDAMDNLVTIANHTSSVTLQTLVAVERSQGKIGRNDIGDAYAYFGVTADSADDNLLIGLYEVKVSDEPLEKNTHQEKLKTIAIARNSTELVQFLKKEKGITSSNNMSVEEMMGVPSHMINNQQNIPVGLNNIGNTCYFNSVLQYYYTLVPFRDTMIHNESYVEDDISEPKKIGGIEVDRSEVRRAKKFVGLLKELFINLQETREKAISPQYDLAYMALLNEKDDDEDDAATTLQEDNSDTEKINHDAVPSMLENKINHVEDQEDVEMTDALSESDQVEVNGNTHVDEAFAEDIRPDSPPPAYNEVVPKEAQPENFITDVKKPVPEITAGSMSEKIPKPNHKTKQRPSADTMMFGKQQDVTECMSNVMYLVEAALKPLSKTEDGEQTDDMIRQLFYGKARQIISYCDNTTSKTVKKEMEEEFSHVIVEVSESKDLYDGLDEYFCASTLENFQGGHEATREVTVKSFPPVLQILFQRVQFDRATQNVYKSNEYIEFYKTIYLDRYLESNFEELKERRDEVGKWRDELEKHKQQVAKYSKSENTDMPIPKLLEAASKILQDFKANTEDMSEEDRISFEKVLNILKKEAVDKQQLINDGTEKIKELKTKIRNQYNDYTKAAYKLHAVFIHQGQANYGHYWIYILDHKENQWWKFNDSTVTKVAESEIFHDTTGSTANPYFLVYVDAEEINDYVETIVTRTTVAPLL